MTAELLVLGGGRMGEALVAGLLSSGRSGITVCERSPERRDFLSRRFDGGQVEVVAEPVACRGAIVAVKPAGVVEVLSALPSVDRVLSIAAGVTTAAMEAALPPGTPVVRAMPNTPALLGEGASAVAAGSSAGETDLAWAEGILGSVGLVVRVEEADLDAVTGLSGSGPAYVFHLAEALIAGGEQAGLAPEVSRALALQTILGAARMLSETGETPAALREAVTSPNGTTAAGLAALAGGDFAGLVGRAVAAAAERSRQLGQA
jgi:pyrroline-5-carboxylate reductase